VEYDPSIIRGLAYYTGVVFEARDRFGEFRAILGGGRYDNPLSATWAATRWAASVFAMGDVVMGLVLEEFDLKPRLRSTPGRRAGDDFRRDAGAQRRPGSPRQLRSDGVKTELYPTQPNSTSK